MEDPSNMMDNVVLSVASDATFLSYLTESDADPNIVIEWHGFLAVVVALRDIEIGEKFRMEWTRPLV